MLWMNCVYVFVWFKFSSFSSSTIFHLFFLLHSSIRSFVHTISAIFLYKHIFSNRHCTVGAIGASAVCGAARNGVRERHTTAAFLKNYSISIYSSYIFHAKGRENRYGLYFQMCIHIFGFDSRSMAWFAWCIACYTHFCYTQILISTISALIQSISVCTQRKYTNTNGKMCDERCAVRSFPLYLFSDFMFYTKKISSKFIWNEFLKKFVYWMHNFMMLIDDRW